METPNGERRLEHCDHRAERLADGPDDDLDDGKPALSRPLTTLTTPGIRSLATQVRM